MARQVRDLARELDVPLGAVLEGGYDSTPWPSAWWRRWRALGGEGEAESVAPDPLLTSRAAAQVGRYWPL